MTRLAGIATPSAVQPDAKRGVMSALVAYTLWGFFPIYFIILRGVASDEILTQRILWSVPFGALIIGMRGQWGEVLTGLRTPKVLLTLMISATFIAANWLVYIYAVQSAQIFEASLGYYINPLIYVLVGVVVLGEKLRPGQFMAVVLASIGVLVLTIYGGKFPTLSLFLAISFTIYGYTRKRVNIGAMPGLFIETLLLTPLAALYLWYLVSQGDATIANGDWGKFGLLALSGPFTVLPLLFFAIAARNLTLGTLGFLQFIGPSIQFIVGLIDGEAFTLPHQICFALIWIAAAVFAHDAWKQRPSQKPKR